MTDEELEAAYVEQLWVVYRRRHGVPWSDPRLAEDSPDERWKLLMLAGCRYVQEEYGVPQETVKDKMFAVLIECHDRVDENDEYYGPHEPLVEISNKIWKAMRGPLLGDGSHR